MGAKQWKAPHFGNGWPSAAAVLTDTNMKSEAKVRSSSQCIEKGHKAEVPLGGSHQILDARVVRHACEEFGLDWSQLPGPKGRVWGNEVLSSQTDAGAIGPDQGEAMYTNILITTDGSELAGKAVEHGIDLAKRIGAKVTVLTVLPPFHTFTTDTQMIEDTPAQYKARMQKQAAKTLGAVTHAAQAAGVACETVQVEHEQTLSKVAPAG
jgi:hypothetical protein